MRVPRRGPRGSEGRGGSDWTCTRCGSYERFRLKSSQARSAVNSVESEGPGGAYNSLPRIDVPVGGLQHASQVHYTIKERSSLNLGLAQLIGLCSISILCGTKDRMESDVSLVILCAGPDLFVTCSSS